MTAAIAFYSKAKAELKKGIACSLNVEGKPDRDEKSCVLGVKTRGINASGHMHIKISCLC